MSTSLFIRSKIDLKLLKDECIGLWIDSVWIQIVYYGNKTSFSYLEKRELFLDLIRYYMDKGLMKFGSRDGTGETIVEWKYAQPCKDTHWLANKVENRNSDEVVAYLEKGFTKNEKSFLDLEGSEENEIAYFYYYCTAVAWFDEKDNEWIWSS